MAQRVSRLAWVVMGVLAVALAAAGIYALWQRGTPATPVPVKGNTVTITFACMDHERGSYEGLVADFQAANPDVQVQIVSANEASGMQQQGGAVVSDGNEVGRLAAAADTFAWYARLDPADNAFLLELGPFVEDPAFPADDFYPGTLDRFRWQGGLYGLPARVLPFLVFYDKSMFDEAGVPYPNTGWTWDDLVAAASQLTEREGDEVTRYGFVDGSPHSTLLAMAQQYGVALWDDRSDPPQPLFDTPEVAEVLRRYTDMALVHEIMPVPEIGSNLISSNLINEGKAAIWTDFAFDREWHARRTDLGLAPLPEGVEAANPSSLYGFFISAGTAHPEAAWRWLSYLSANYQPPSTDMLPGRRSAGERLPWWRRLDRETRTVYEYVLAHPSAAGSTDWPLWGAAVAMLQEGMGAEEALATAQAQALAMQAALAQATPAALQPVASPQSTAKAGKTTITFAPAIDADGSLYRALAANFHEEHPDISVEVTASSYDPAELATSRDCFAYSGLYLVADPRVRSLQPLLEADAGTDLDDFYPQFLASLQQGGALWGLPYEADALMVYANVERFAEGGVAPPAPGWTMQDFLERAAALSDGESRYGFATREGAYTDLLFVLERLGAQLFDDSHDTAMPTFDDPTVVRALRQYATLARDRALTPAMPATQGGWPESVVVGNHPTGVEAGQVAMWVDALGYQPIAPPLPFETQVAPLPVGTQASTEFMIRAYYISLHSPAPEACWAWLTFLSSQPQTVHLLPARRSVAASPLWQQGVDGGALSAYLATLDYAGTVLFDLRWQIPWLGYAYPWLDQAFQATVAGEDPRRALGEAQAQAEALVACLEDTRGFPGHAQLLACARQVDPAYPVRGDGP